MIADLECKFPMKDVNLAPTDVPALLVALPGSPTTPGLRRKPCQRDCTAWDDMTLELDSILGHLLEQLLSMAMDVVLMEEILMGVTEKVINSFLLFQSHIDKFDYLYFQMMYLEDVVVVVRKAWVVEDMWEENQPWSTMKKVQIIFCLHI